MKKLLFIFTLLLSLCRATFAADNTLSTQQYSQRPDVNLIVMLDWFANPTHAPLFVAKEKGFFSEQGLDVELIGPADPSDPPKLAAIGKADIAITYQPEFMQQIDQGLPLIRIGTLIDKPLDCLVVLKDGPIKTLADLKGKRVGYSSGGMNSLALQTMLAEVGLTLKDIEHINVRYDLTQALLSGQVDAVTGIMRTFEIIQMDLANHPARAFFPEKYKIPTYNELIFVTKKNNIHDPRLPKFLAALQKGTLYLQHNPKEAWLLFAKNHPELNNTLNRQAWFASLPYFPADPAAFDSKQWLLFADYMHKNGLIKNVAPISTYAIDLTKE